MTKFEIVEAKPWHCGAMARMLRHRHLAIVEQAGVNVHRELRQCFDASAFRRAWLIDGELAAIGGVMGTLASPTGTIWLALSERATRYPLAIVKEARRQIADIMATRQQILTSIVFGDDAARRLAIFLNFHVAHDGVGDAAYSRAARKALSQAVETYDERIVSFGGVRAVIMGYRAEELEWASQL